MTAQYQGVWSLQSAAQLQSTQRWVTDPLFENTTLLLQADDAANGAQNNTFLDSSSNAFAITRNGNTTQGSFTPFSLQPGAWGNSFNGSNQIIATPDSSITALDLTGDFTIELWFYATGNVGHLVNRGGGTNIAWASYEVWTGNANNVYFAASSNNNGYDIGGENATGLIGSYALNTWNHVAVTRSGNVYRGFLNGVQGYTQTLSLTPYTPTGRGITIGGAYQNSWGVVGNIFSCFAGFLSNVRILKGTALYTANFTPSTAPLTAITNTSLLTCQSNRFVDNSTNSFAITPYNSASVQPFSPFAPQFQWTPSVIGGSGYFDGNADFLSIASQTNLALGSGDFTIEYWVYPTSFAANNAHIMWITAGDYPALFHNTSGNVVLDRYGTSAVATTSSALTLNAWNHVACARSGTTLRIFINGTQGASVTNSTNWAQSAIQIGNNNITNYLFGYMSNLRVVKGTAVYTGAFTPPTRPLSDSGAASAASYPSTTNVNTSFAASNTQLLLNFTNAGIYDGTMKNNLETVGNAQVNTAVVKYGSGSMFFDGNGDYLLAKDISLGNFGSSDFTVEFWAYDLSRSSSGTAWIGKWGNPASLGRCWILAFTSSSGVYEVGISTNGSTAVVPISVSYAPPLNTWNHHALTRSGNIYRLFVNGSLIGSGTNSGTLFSTDEPLCIGANYEDVQASINNYNVNGYMDDVRITVGIARYTQNFIPPSVALPRQ